VRSLSGGFRTFNVGRIPILEVEEPGGNLELGNEDSGCATGSDEDMKVQICCGCVCRKDGSEFIGGGYILKMRSHVQS
jgi:hypothetical protein